MRVLRCECQLCAFVCVGFEFVLDNQSRKRSLWSIPNLLLILAGCIHNAARHQLYHRNSLCSGRGRCGWAGCAGRRHVVRIAGPQANGWGRCGSSCTNCRCHCSCCWRFLTLIGRQHKTLPAKLISFKTSIRRRRPAIEFNTRIRWDPSGLGQLSHEAASLHALAVRSDAIARELGAATAAYRHQTGIACQCSGRRAAGCGSNDIATAALIHGLRITERSLKLALEGLQLLHEVEVWRYVRFPITHQHEGVVQAECACVHQIGEGHRHGARHARQAVDQHCWARRARFLCKQRKEKQAELMTEKPR